MIEAAAHDLGASAITLAEVLIGPARVNRLDEARTAVRNIGIDEIPLPWGVAERLATLRISAGLKLPDCCVLLAAEDVAAEAVLTFDDRLAEAARVAGFVTGVPLGEPEAADEAPTDLRGVPEGGSSADGTQWR